MCGIFGYIGSQDSVKVSLNGIKKLEYRGYDSSGIAGVKNGRIFYCKEVGKIHALEKKMTSQDFSLDVSIAHTRWATHGNVTTSNAHPHLDMTGKFALVHNGIIENHDILRRDLIKKGVRFQSETDTEVIVQLISLYYKGDILKAIQEVLPILEGALAIALVHQDHPQQIVAAVRESPLVIGVGQDESFVASDTNAFTVHTRDVLFLENMEVALVQAGDVKVYDQTVKQVNKEKEVLIDFHQEVTKQGYEHYTLKEIFEQPQTIKHAFLSRLLFQEGNVKFDQVHFSTDTLKGVERILILACGTSWHAGLYAAYLLENKARIPVEVEVSSEFRYKNPIVEANTLVIAISQSGETADTLAALKELKAKGARILGICNVLGSTLARLSDSCIFLKAGPEIGVCSTKAYTSQIVVLFLFSVLMARMRHMSQQEGFSYLDAMNQMPGLVQKVLSQKDKIADLAKRYASHENFFFLGRQYMYPAALEGALKLKEISYINACAYPAGEMKHGPIALIDASCPTIALCANTATFPKMLSNIMEVKARCGKVIAIANESQSVLEKYVDELIYIPDTIDELSIIPQVVVTQLFAYYVAKERGCEIDQPRNLAKSVTVE